MSSPILSGVALSAALALGAARFFPSPLPIADPNDNRRPAGTLRDGVLAVTLEARRVRWHPNGDSLPGMEVEAFGEPGRAAQVPGPLIRVPAGTETRLTVRNTFTSDTLSFIVPTAMRGEPGPPLDSVRVVPGASAELVFKAAVPGNYYYRATTGKRSERITRLAGLLTGAIVVDSAGTNPGAPSRDRIFVLTLALDSVLVDSDGNSRLFGFNFGINGRSWPHTERLAATVGDTIRWRVINANFDLHPMHLHGFYFKVDSITGPAVALQGQGPPGRMVVTERMSAFSTMSMSWIPEKAGNWLFHCHWSVHLLLPSRAAGAREPEHRNHALEGMAGLVLGVEVKPRAGEAVSDEGTRTPRRRLRLVAVQDSAYPDSTPAMRFRLEERGVASTRTTSASFSPPIELVRGEPVSIMVVNRLSEPTAVHWHGIELDSYYDGVAGFSGAGSRLSPVIAPSDSFEARITPPRAGTFIYHSHINEPRQQRAGLLGALIVRDAGARPVDAEHTFFLKSSRVRGAVTPIEIDGQAVPDTVRMRVGRPYRVRLIAVTTLNPNAAVMLTARPDSSFANVPDSLLQQWRPLAKDGADYPEALRIPRRARQVISMGETYDFEFTPRQPGHLRLEVRGAAANGRLLNRVPIKVE